MAKVVVERFDCDRCGKPGRRYEVTFDDGETRIMDRCDIHGKKFESLRDEPGEWKQEANIRRYHKTDVDSIMKAVRSADSH